MFDQQEELTPAERIAKKLLQDDRVAAAYDAWIESNNLIVYASGEMHDDEVAFIDTVSQAIQYRSPSNFFDAEEKEFLKRNDAIVTVAEILKFEAMFSLSADYMAMRLLELNSDVIAAFATAQKVGFSENSAEWKALDKAVRDACSDEGVSKIPPEEIPPYQVEYLKKENAHEKLMGAFKKKLDEVEKSQGIPEAPNTSHTKTTWREIFPKQRPKAGKFTIPL